MKETVKEISMIMIPKIDIKEIIRRIQSLGNNFHVIDENKNMLMILYSIDVLKLRLILYPKIYGLHISFMKQVV